MEKPSLAQLKSELDQQLRPRKKAAKAVKAQAKAVEDSTSTTVVASPLEKVARRLDISANVTMELLKSDTTANWIICDNLIPVAVIALDDQEEKKSIASYFVSPEYKSNILSAVAKMNSWKTPLEQLNARLISNGKLVAAASPVNVQEIEANLLRRFSQVADLAVTTMAKNIMENPLKASLLEVLNKYDVANPLQVIESVFEEGGRETIQAILAKAEEWMALAPEMFEVLKAEFESANKRDIQDLTADDYEDEDEESDELAEDEDGEDVTAALLARNSVHLSTSSTKSNSFRERAKNILK